MVGSGRRERQCRLGKVIDTIGRTHPSVADQMPASDKTLALVTPRPLSTMVEHEMLQALADNANLLAAAQTHLPGRMRALATYPPYRLELPSRGKPKAGWQAVEWRTLEKSK